METVTAARKLEYLQQLCMYHNIDYDAITAHDTGFVNTQNMRDFILVLSKRYPSEDKLEPRKTW